MPTRGFQSSVDYKQVFGIGAVATVDSVVVLWPNRTISSFTDLKADTLHQISQAVDANKLIESTGAAPQTIFTFTGTTLTSTQKMTLWIFIMKEIFRKCCRIKDPKLQQVTLIAMANRYFYLWCRWAGRSVVPADC